MANWLLFDTETCGLRYGKDPILSVGAVLWDDVTDRKEEFYELWDWTRIPGFHLVIPEQVSSINGITVESLQADPLAFHPVKAAAHLYRWLLDSLPEERWVLNGLVAWNSPFDINMMRSNLQWLVQQYPLESERLAADGFADPITQQDVESLHNLLDLFTRFRNGKPGNVLFVDALCLDRILHFEEDGIKCRHDLESAGARYGLDPNQHAHNAIYDTLRLAAIFQCQLEELRKLHISMDADLERRIERKFVHHASQYRGGAGESYWGEGVALPEWRVHHAG